MENRFFRIIIFLGFLTMTLGLPNYISAHVKDEKGKKHNVCFECQKKFPGKKEILANLK